MDLLADLLEVCGPAPGWQRLRLGPGLTGGTGRLVAVVFLPSGHAPFDALVSDEFQIQSRLAEDAGRRTSGEVLPHAFAFERLVVGDAPVDDAADHGQ